jgi:hypothetical protein
LGQKLLLHKDLRQKDFSRFLAISAQRKRAILGFLLLCHVFLAKKQMLSMNK